MKKQRNQIQDLFWLYRPYWQYGKFFVLVSLFFWMLILPLCRVLMVIFPEQMVRALENGWTFSKIALLVIAFQTALLVIPVFEDIYNICCRDRAQARIEIKIKKQVYEQSLRTDYCFVDQPEYYNRYMWAVEHQAEKAEEAFSLVNRALSALTIMVTLISMIAAFNPVIVIFTLVSMALRTYGYIKYNQYEVRREESLMASHRRLGYFHRIFYLREYKADLKSTRLKEYIFKHYDTEADHKLGIIKSYAKRLLFWAVFSDMIYRIMMTLIILLVSYSIFKAQYVEAASYITVMLSVEKLEDSMYEFFELFQQGGKLSLYAGDIRRFYEMESTIESGKEAGGKRKPADGPFLLDMEQVGFRYPHSEFAIENFTLHIKPGEKIAIVGENGVGKSTLLKLLLRLYDPLHGEIKINQIPLPEYELESLRRRIGVVFQDTHMYALSLRENMELYQRIEDKKAEAMLSELHLEKLMSKNAATMDTILTKEFDEKGIVVSVGEAQKIGLARVMQGDFGLLLLDEPSSALDPIAEYEMNQLILNRSQKATTIVVAHRLSTVRDMDRIIVMANGCIAESGTHEELMQQKGCYYQMFTKQAENYLK
ncbi:MAG: ABC transporter ATP-binding protein [Lachnospiraceae bacterium]|jgi:ATP-binding cassette subfamily B protein|nr:ABC transporter ATP-binding protein [Lachnospiraceae bacterium]